MDFYFRSSIDDLVVPKDGDFPDRLPSPDSWFKWGVNSSESFGSGNKYFGMDSDFTREELNFYGKRPHYDVEMGASEHSKDQSSDVSVGGAFSNSLQRSALSHGQPDYQLDDFPGIGHMDDMFLSSLLEDLPEIGNCPKSVSFSPGFQSGTKPSERVQTRAVDSHESSKYARTDGIYTPEQKGHPLVKMQLAECFSFSEENSPNGYVGEDTPLEEYVLQDLEIVMTQLTDKTRICFRDALYRLAKNSKQYTKSGTQIDNQTGDFLMEEAPPWTAHGDTIRVERKQPMMESETNSIDRAVANLMFSETESYVNNNTPIAASAELKQQAVEASSIPDYGFLCEQTLSGDAVVPIHRELNSCAISM